MNNSSYVFEDRTFHHNVYTAYGFLEAICVVLIVPTNIILLLSILSSRKLRQHFWYQLIVSIAIADLLIGTITCTLQTIYILANYVPDCAVYVLYGLVEDFAHVCVGLWSITLLNVDCILKMFRIGRPSFSGWKNSLVVTALSTSPWIFFLAVVCPLLFFYIKKDNYVWTNYCFLRREIWESTADVIIILYIPSCLIVVCLLVIGTFMICTKAKCKWVQDYDHPEHPKILIVSSLIVVCAVFQQEITEYFAYVDYGNRTWLVVLMLGIVIGDLRSFVLPVVWMFMPDIKERLTELRTRFLRFVRRPRLSDNLSVSYKNMSEEVTV